MFKKIIVALDGSPNSEKALDAALSICHFQSSQLSFIHVVKEIHPHFATGEISLSVSELNSALDQNGEHILRLAAEKANKEAMESNSHLRSGDPAEKILDLAKEENADLIIIGSRGLGTLKEWMMGSVSHKVAQLAPCPVLIMK